MKKHLCKFIILLHLVGKVAAQTIPYNVSADTITTSDGYQYPICYYKPFSYDSIAGDIIWGVHGSGATGYAEINDLAVVAQKRHALIVAPTDLSAGWGFTRIDTVNNDTIVYWGPEIYKEVYRHVLKRENRDTMWVHMIGFSAGGQGVTRYMLLRQVFPDSIPIRMAVSTNPMFYAFATDFLNGSCMPWPCGLGVPDLPFSSLPLTIVDAYFVCPEHVIQYYNENYAVLIGTGDNAVPTGSAWGCECMTAQGIGRYQRALNFYNFSAGDAVARGTTFTWQYAEIPGVAHDQHLMYTLQANAADSMSVAERLLFETPYHSVPSVAVKANFHSESNPVNINCAVDFINTSINATNYLWDFGDGDTSTYANPKHVYSLPGTYTVKLTAFSTTCNNVMEKKQYLTVTVPSLVNSLNSCQNAIIVTPNPAINQVTITANGYGGEIDFILYDVIGRKLKQISFSGSATININELSEGIYIFSTAQKGFLRASGKLIKN